MTEKGSDQDTGIDRRKLLQATGVAAGSMLGMKNVSAQEIKQSAEKISEVEFVEVLIEHQNTPDYPVGGVDKFATYRVEEDVLLLGNFIDKKTDRYFIENDRIMSNNGRITTVQSAISSRPSNKYLTVETGIDGRPSKKLQLEEPYSPPSPNVEMDDGAVLIRVNSTSTKVKQGSENKLFLSERSVMVREKSNSYKVIEDPRRGGKTMTKERGKVNSIEVTPVITIKNHGRVKVHGVGGE